MTHPMLEKVARAICVGKGKDPDYCTHGSVGMLVNGVFHQGSFRYRWQDELPAARAAVQALLEPDEGMVEEGTEICRAAYMEDRDANQANARDVYQSMLLTVLADEWEEQIPWPKREDVSLPSSGTFQPTPGVYETQHRRVAARGEG